MYVISGSKNNQTFENSLNAQNFNSKPVLESVLVTESKTVLGFSCLAPEVLFSGYPEMPKIKLLGTQKMALLVLNTNIREQLLIQ